MAGRGKTECVAQAQHATPERALWLMLNPNLSGHARLVVAAQRHLATAAAGDQRPFNDRARSARAVDNLSDGGDRGARDRAFLLDKKILVRLAPPVKAIASGCKPRGAN